MGLINYLFGWFEKEFFGDGTLIGHSHNYCGGDDTEEILAQKYWDDMKKLFYGGHRGKIVIENVGEEFYGDITDFREKSYGLELAV